MVPANILSVKKMYSQLKKQKRTWVDIVCDIVTVCDKEQTKTAIVGKCNLNFKLIPRYLEVLTRSGFLEEIDDGEHATYRATSRGRELGNEIIKIRESISFYESPMLIERMIPPFER